MNMLGKILASTITAIFAVIGGIWTAFTVLNATMDSKVAEAKQTMRIERDAQIKEVKSEINGVKTLVKSIDGKLDTLIAKREK